MKTLAIRYWLVIALAIFFVSAVSPFVFVGAVVCRTEKAAPDVVSFSNMLSADIAHWSDPTWQGSLDGKLPTDVSVVLLNATNQVLFRMGKAPLDPTPAGYTQIMVMDGTRLAGIADLYDVAPCGGRIYGTLALPASLLVQIGVGVGIAWVLRRYVLRPLAAMSIAARQIALGNLDFQLPPSRVREVADVALAFRAMGNDLHQSITRQAGLEQDRRFFISAIAHDLRTPLFSLRGYLEGLEKGIANTPEKTAHYIAVCQEKADTLERLITNLFDYARLEYLEQSPNRARMDFSELINQTLDDVRFRAEERHIKLSAESTCAPCEVYADSILLSRVLGNLLDNALRYTPRAGSIQVHWQKERDLITFTVADTGPGIAAQDLPHIFEPLYRADPSRNSQTGGAGLGLSIARRILQAHGGNLTAANGKLGGAEFTGTFRTGL